MRPRRRANNIFCKRLLTRWTTLALLLTLCGVASAQHDLSNDISAELLGTLRVVALDDLVYVQPRQSATLNVQVDNSSNQTQRVQPEVTLPDGWRLLLSPLTLRLGPNEAKTLSFTVRVPEDAATGSYAVRVSLGDLGTEPAVFIAQVTSPKGLAVELARAPNQAGGRYEARFTVRNRSDEPVRVRLNPRDNLGLSLVAVPREATLPAGTLLDVLVTVEADTLDAATLDLPRDHLLRLAVQAVDDPALQAIAQTRVTLVDDPRMGLNFPLEAEVRSEVRGGSSGSDLAQNVTVDVSGVGRVAERDDGELALSLENSLAEQRNSLRYRNDQFQVVLGNSGFRLGPLAIVGDDVGLRLDNTIAVNRNLLLRTQTFVTVPDRGGRFGVRAALPLAPSGELFAYTLFPADLSDATFVGTGGRWFPALSSSVGLNLGGTYSFQTPSETTTAQSALQLYGALSSEVGSLWLGWQGQSPNYLGSDVTAQIEAGGRVALGDSSSLTTQYVRRESRTVDSTVDSTADATPDVTTETTREFDTVLETSFGDDTLRFRIDNWQVQDALSRERDAQVGFELDLALSAERSFAQALGFAFERGDTTSNALRYRAGLELPTDEGFLRPTLDFDYGLGATPTSLALGFDWAAVPSEVLELYLDYSLGINQDDLIALDAGGRYQLGERHALRVALSANVDRVRGTDVGVGIGVRRALNGVLTPRTQVYGSVLDAQGEGVSNVTLTLGDQQTTTDATGAFAFRDLLAGQYVLSTDLGTDLGTDNVTTLPSTPLQLDIRPEEDVQVRLQLVDRAAVQGFVRSAEGAALAEVLLEITPADRAATAVRTVTNREGLFRFGGLEPGTWHLDVVETSVPDWFASGDEIEIGLEPGDLRTLDLTLHPR